MRLKDAFVGFLFWIGILVFGAFLITADNLPMWVLFVVAVIAWIGYILMAFRDKARDRRKIPEFYIKTRGGQVVPLSSVQTPQPLYDQEADKE